MITTRTRRHGHRIHKPDTRSDILWLLDQPVHIVSTEDEIEEPAPREEKLIGGWRFVLALIGLCVAYSPFLYFAVVLWLGAPTPPKPVCNGPVEMLFMPCTPTKIDLGP